MDSPEARRSIRSTVEGISRVETAKEMKRHQATKDVSNSGISLMKIYPEEKSSEMPQGERRRLEGVDYQSESTVLIDSPDIDGKKDFSEQQRVLTGPDTTSFWTLAQEDNDPWIDTPMEDLDSILALPKDSTDDYEPVPYASLIRGSMVAVADSNRGEKRKQPTHSSNSRTQRNDVDMTVGPYSWQMDLVQEMMEFANSLAAHNLEYIDEDPSTVASTLKHIIEVCTSGHLEGLDKYRNLPGAVFEEGVDRLGGATFLKLFKAVSVDRVKLKEKKIRISTTLGDEISLIEFAVGYGMHLAHQLSSTGVGKQLTREEAVKEGARGLLTMTNEARVSFWKANIRSEEDTLS